MKVCETNLIYENPLPQLRSVQSYFPFLFELPNGKIGAVTVLHLLLQGYALSLQWAIAIALRGHTPRDLF